VVNVIDTNGCTGSNSTYVEVTNTGDCLFIPDLVTPNLDGLNDTWEIQGLENFVNAEVEIYNRWGNLIYSASPYDTPWDATVNKGATIDGKDGKVPVGTYFYIINLNEDDYPPFKGYIEVEY
jgi:gliding motility-associated-like protein